MSEQQKNITKTTKRIAREAKIAKKLANQRTKEERITEINKIKNKLTELGIHIDLFTNFEKITNDFIETGSSCNGKISAPEIERELFYIFSNDKRIQISSMLKYVKK